MSKKHDSVVELLRECAGDSHAMKRLREELGVECVRGWQQRCLAEVADMAEYEFDEEYALARIRGERMMEASARLAGLLVRLDVDYGIDAEWDCSHGVWDIKADGEWCIEKDERIAELEAEVDDWRAMYNQAEHDRRDALMRADVFRLRCEELEEDVGRLAEADSRWEAMRRELERTIAERDACYMKLPVDADGVPIRPGEYVEYNGHVERVNAVGGSGFTSAPMVASEMCRHAKTDTVAEELAKFLSACGDDDPHYYDEEIAEFAERIRKVTNDGN